MSVVLRKRGVARASTEVTSTPQHDASLPQRSWTFWSGVRMLLVAILLGGALLSQHESSRKTVVAQNVRVVVDAVANTVVSHIPKRFRFFHGVAIVTVASHQKVLATHAEYGELKTAFVYPVSVDNKARFCALHGCTLVVGGSVPETEGRSARWNKVAWLRRSFFQYEWLVWMDLDALFAHPDHGGESVQGSVLGSLLDPTFDLHVTTDFKNPNRINTGFFAIRTKSAWSFRFLEQVWSHNDFGEGQSDQRSFNAVVASMSIEERASHVKVHPRRVFNSFPVVEYVEVEDFQPPRPNGDELANTSTSSGSLVTHFAGVFGGARSTDGVTPPLLLLQFTDLLLERHQRFLRHLRLNTHQHQQQQHQHTPASNVTQPSVAHNAAAAAAAATSSDAAANMAAMAAAVAPLEEAEEAVSHARAVLAPCLSKLSKYQPVEADSFGSSAHSPHAPSKVPPFDDPSAACDPFEPLMQLRRVLSTLLPATMEVTVAATAAQATYLDDGADDGADGNRDVSSPKEEKERSSKQEPGAELGRGEDDADRKKSDDDDDAGGGGGGRQRGTADSTAAAPVGIRGAATTTTATTTTTRVVPVPWPRFLLCVEQPPPLLTALAPGHSPPSALAQHRLAALTAMPLLYLTKHGTEEEEGGGFGQAEDGEAFDHRAHDEDDHFNSNGEDDDDEADDDESDDDESGAFQVLASVQSSLASGWSNLLRGRATSPQAGGGDSRARVLFPPVSPPSPAAAMSTTREWGREEGGEEREGQEPEQRQQVVNLEVVKDSFVFLGIQSVLTMPPPQPPPSSSALSSLWSSPSSPLSVSSSSILSTGELHTRKRVKKGMSLSSSLASSSSSSLSSPVFASRDNDSTSRTQKVVDGNVGPSTKRPKRSRRRAYGTLTVAVSGCSFLQVFTTTSTTSTSMNTTTTTTTTEGVVFDSTHRLQHFKIDERKLTPAMLATPSFGDDDEGDNQNPHRQRQRSNHQPKSQQQEHGGGGGGGGVGRHARLAVFPPLLLLPLPPASRRQEEERTAATALALHDAHVWLFAAPLVLLYASAPPLLLEDDAELDVDVNADVDVDEGVDEGDTLSQRHGSLKVASAGTAPSARARRLLSAVGAIHRKRWVGQGHGDEEGDMEEEEEEEEVFVATGGLASNGGGSNTTTSTRSSKLFYGEELLTFHELFRSFQPQGVNHGREEGAHAQLQLQFRELAVSQSWRTAKALRSFVDKKEEASQGGGGGGGPLIVLFCSNSDSGRRRRRSSSSSSSSGGDSSSSESSSGSSSSSGGRPEKHGSWCRAQTEALEETLSKRSSGSGTVVVLDGDDKGADSMLTDLPLARLMRKAAVIVGPYPTTPPLLTPSTRSIPSLQYQDGDDDDDDDDGGGLGLEGAGSALLLALHGAVGNDPDDNDNDGCAPLTPPPRSSSSSSTKHPCERAFYYPEEDTEKYRKAVELNLQKAQAPRVVYWHSVVTQPPLPRNSNDGSNGGGGGAGDERASLDRRRQRSSAASSVPLVVRALSAAGLDCWPVLWERGRRRHRQRADQRADQRAGSKGKETEVEEVAAEEDQKKAHLEAVVAAVVAAVRARDDAVYAAKNSMRRHDSKVKKVEAGRTGQRWNAEGGEAAAAAAEMVAYRRSSSSSSVSSSGREVILRREGHDAFQDDDVGHGDDGGHGGGAGRGQRRQRRRQKRMKRRSSSMDHP